MSTNLRAVPFRPYTFPHLTPVRPSVQSGEAQDGPSWTGASCNTALACEREASCEPGDHTYSWPCEYAPGTGRLATGRRMVAVTVALSEPFDATPELDWAATVASVLRLTYANTTVEVIDSWSPSDLASFGLEQSGRVDA